MKMFFTAAFICLLGIAWAQNQSMNPNYNSPRTSAVPTAPLPILQTQQSKSQLEQTAPTTADKIQEENRITQERAEQALRRPAANRRNQTVCLQNDVACLREEARNRINQNNGTVKDNPTDLNNRPNY